MGKAKLTGRLRQITCNSATEGACFIFNSKGESMKLFLRAAAFAILVSGTIHAAFYGAKGQIGYVNYYFQYGRQTEMTAYVYDYVGGNQLYGITLLENAAGLPGKQDLSELKKALDLSFANWTQISFTNFSRNDHAVYTGNNFALNLYH
jgi:hypothetical protein